MNEKVLYNKYHEKFSEFKDAIFGFLQKLSDPPIELAGQLAKRLTESFQIIGNKQHVSS